ncbi:hypothetical protein [Salinibacter altiplanensis]|uniref:hypothetical protein n=1 Tax=Salinibacter altiplanensis TaxID=1803181 RepID=UPI000C9FCB53|nr:hypothetical protein [Salinibacter altiplanensis]
MSSLALNIGRAVVILAVASVAFYVGQERAPAPAGPAETDTVRVESAEPDTSAPVAWPVIFRIHDTVRTTETKVETLRVPTAMNVGGVITDTPVRRKSSFLGPDELVLTSFDPFGQRYEQRSYELGRRAWALWPEVEIRTTPEGLYGAGRIGLRWRQVTVTGGYAAVDGSQGIEVGLRWRPGQLSW